MADNTTYLTTAGKNAIALNIQDPVAHPLHLSLVNLYNEAPVITSDGNIDTSTMTAVASSDEAAIQCNVTDNVIQISTTITSSATYSAKTMLIFFTDNDTDTVFAYYTQDNSDSFPEVSVFNMVLKVDNEYDTTVTFDNLTLECPLAAENLAGKVQFKNPPCLSDIDLDSNNVPYVLRPSQVEAGSFIGTAVINPAGEGIDYIKGDALQYVKNLFIKGSELSLNVDHNTTISFTASETGESDITGTLSWNYTDSGWEASSTSLDSWMGGDSLKLADFGYGSSIVVFTGASNPDFTNKTLTLTWGSNSQVLDSDTLWTSNPGWHKALSNSTGTVERWVMIPENHFSKLTITFTSAGATPEFSQVFEHIFTPADNTDGTSPSLWILPIAPSPESTTDYLITAVERIY